jgi:hypothetical protein
VTEAGFLDDLREEYASGRLTIAQLEEATWNFLNGYWPGFGIGVSPPATCPGYFVEADSAA